MPDPKINLTDPTHLKGGPCDSCGANWDWSASEGEFMQHTFTCAYVFAADNEAASRIRSETHKRLIDRAIVAAVVARLEATFNWRLR